MIKAVIFDMDGTLIETLDSMSEAGNRMLGDLGLPPRKREEYRYFAGNGADLLVGRVLDASGVFDPWQREKARERYLAYFAETCTHGVVPYEGIEELLETLGARGIRRAVFTNKPGPQASQVANKIFGDGCFDLVRGQEEGVPLKPCCEGLELIRSALGVQKEECLYLGDTGVDMRAGKGGGLYTVGALWGFRDREELIQNGADELCAHPLDLLGILERRNRG